MARISQSILVTSCRTDYHSCTSSEPMAILSLTLLAVMDERPMAVVDLKQSRSDSRYLA